MLQTRIIPCLQLIGEALVKTVKFGSYSYIGDPINTVRIFNELEVDELCFLDIRATKEQRTPNFEILRGIADECFMPLSYGGGIRDVATAKRILSIGFEKVVINSAAFEVDGLIKDLAAEAGTQSIIGSIDVKRNIWGNYNVYICDGTKKIDMDPVTYAQHLEALGVGELLVTSMDNDGTWKGFDLEITKKIAASVNVPIIANGGAGSVQNIGDIVKKAKVSAVGLGSMVVFQQKGLGVLVNFPDKTELQTALS